MEPINEKHRCLIENLPDALAYHQVLTDNEGKPVDYVFLDVNQAFEEMTGLSRGDTIGKKVTDLLPGIENSNFDWSGTYGRVALDGETTSFEQYSEPLNRWYAVTTYSDEPGKFAMSIRDITTSKKEKYDQQLLLDNIETQIWYLKDVETYGSVNQAHADFLGVKKEELENKSLYELRATAGEAEACIAGNREVFSQKRKIYSEELVLNSNGEERLLAITKTPKLDDNNNAEYVVCSAEDITARKETELQLERSKEKYKKLAEQAPVAILTCDKAGRIDYINERMLGYLGSPSKEKTKEINLFDFHLLKETGFSGILEQCLRTGETKDFEMEYKSYWGKRVYAKVYISPFEENERITGAQIIADDITERRQVEERLHNSEEKLRGILNNMTDVVWSISWPDLKPLYISPSVEKLYGQSEQRFYDNPTLFEEATHPDDQHLTEKAMEQLLEYGEATRECRIKRPDGSMIWVNDRSKLIYDENHQPIRVEGVTQDITERKQAEESLRKAVTNINALLANSPTLISIFDKDGRYIEVSASTARVIGLPPEDIKGRTFAELLPPASAAEFMQTVDDLREKQYSIIKTDIIQINGEDRIFETLLFPIEQNGTDIELIGSIAMDITERRRFEQELSRSEERFQKMLSLVPDMISIHDPDMNIIYSNWNGFNEVPQERRVLNTKCYRTYRGYDDICPDCQAKRVLKTKEAIHEEVELPERMWVDLRVIPILGQDGSVELFVEWVRDITDRKQQEQEIITQKNLLEGIMDNVSDVLSIQHPDHSIEQYNRAGYELLGMTPEEVRGKPCYELIGRDSKCAECATSRALQSGELEQTERYFPELGVYLDCRSTPVFEDSHIVWVVQHLRDVTDRKRMEQQILNEKERFKTTLLSVGDGVISTDVQGNVLMMNKVAERLTDWTQEEAVGKPVEEVFTIINEFNREICDNPVAKVLATGDVIQLANHTVLMSKDGIERPIEDSAAPIRDEKGNITGMVLVFKDVSDKKKVQDEIQYLGFHDVLTGLYNRRFLEEEMKRLDTERQLPISFIMVDVNGLKLVNDTYGHATGDVLLKRAADILKKACREEDIIVRWGGDEFVILLPQTTAEDAEKIQRRIMTNCKGVYVQDVPVSISLGYAYRESMDRGMFEILSEAEDYMYKHKVTESRSTKHDVLSTLLVTLGEKSQETEAHTRRLQKVARQIAERLALPEFELNRLDLLVILHDIGKITVPAEILSKEGPLTSEEWEIIKKHSETGYRIARSTEEFSHVAEDILAHHERWDGTGYPHGLKGRDIPLLARIVAIADAYEVMHNGRPYKKSMPKADIMAELKRCAGTQFDPELVELLVWILEE